MVRWCARVKEVKPELEGETRSDVRHIAFAINVIQFLFISVLLVNLTHSNASKSAAF